MNIFIFIFNSVLHTRYESNKFICSYLVEFIKNPETSQSVRFTFHSDKQIELLDYLVSFEK